MSNKVYIHDAHGTQIPLVDEFGNLSMQVIMLYTEDKLTSTDRKTVDAFVANDEMSRDALEGYMLTNNASRTRHVVNEMNAAIQKRSGAKAVSTLMPKEDNNFDFRRMAAAIGLLVVIGGATFIISKVWNEEKLADNVLPVSDAEETAPATSFDIQPVETLMDSISDEATEQDKTVVTDVAVDDELPTTKGTKRFEEPNQTVLREKKVEKSEPEQLKTTRQERLQTVSDEREDASDNSQKVAGASEKATSNDLADSEPVVELASDVSERTKPRGQVVAKMAAESALAQSAEEATTLSRAESTERPASAENKNEPARFPGGDIKMYKFIERKKNYPEALQQQGISGAITVTFDVDENGQVVNSKVKNSVNGILDADALRIVRSMPKWNPALKNGKPVRTTRSVVIKYGN